MADRDATPWRRSLWRIVVLVNAPRDRVRGVRAHCRFRCAAHATRSVTSTEGLQRLEQKPRKQPDEHNGETARTGTDVASTHRDRARLEGSVQRLNGEKPKQPDKRNGERTRGTASGTPPPDKSFALFSCGRCRARRPSSRSGPPVLCRVAVSLIRPFPCRFRSNRCNDPFQLSRSRSVRGETGYR